MKDWMKLDACIRPQFDGPVIVYELNPRRALRLIATALKKARKATR